MSPIIKKYCSDLNEEKKYFVFPFRYDAMTVKEEKREENDYIKIVVPGMVDNKRRDYDQLFDVLKRHFENNPDTNIRICCLGKIKNKQYEEIIKKINGEREYISFFTKFINDDEYDDHIRKSNFLLSNSRMTEKRYDCTEIYGITKESGTSYLIYAFAKPAIVPRYQILFVDMESQTLRYDNAEGLLDILHRIDRGDITVSVLEDSAKRNKALANALLEYIRKA
jgi:hypothetical protein